MERQRSAAVKAYAGGGKIRNFASPIARWAMDDA